MNSLCKCIERYKKMRRIALFGVASIGIGSGLYKIYRNYMELEEDKEYYKRYTEENSEENYKSKLDFYEDVFKKQDEQEEKELKEAVDQFNSRRLNRENCPICGEKTRMKRKRNRSNYENRIKRDEAYIYLEK